MSLNNFIQQGKADVSESAKKETTTFKKEDTGTSLYLQEGNNYLILLPFIAADGSQLWNLQFRRHYLGEGNNVICLYHRDKLAESISCPLCKVAQYCYNVLDDSKLGGAFNGKKRRVVLGIRLPDASIPSKLPSKPKVLETGVKIFEQLEAFAEGGKNNTIGKLFAIDGENLNTRIVCIKKTTPPQQKGKQVFPSYQVSLEDDWVTLKNPKLPDIVKYPELELTDSDIVEALADNVISEANKAGLTISKSGGGGVGSIFAQYKKAPQPVSQTEVAPQPVQELNDPGVPQPIQELNDPGVPQPIETIETTETEIDVETDGKLPF